MNFTSYKNYFILKVFFGHGKSMRQKLDMSKRNINKLINAQGEVVTTKEQILQTVESVCAKLYTINANNTEIASKPKI